MPRTIECEGAVAKPGEGLPRKHAILSGKPLVDKLSEKVTTLYENLLHGASLSSNEPFMGTRSILNGAAGPYDWIYYDEAVRRAKNIGAFMANRKIPEKANIGLYSVNRVEWVLAEQGCFSQNYVTVPLYDTLGTEAIQYIVNQTEQQIVFASKDKVIKYYTLDYVNMCFKD
jgi:long-chain acyl-CoA synthetase